MKTIIVAFWLSDPVSKGESKFFEINESMVKFLQEEKVYLVSFDEVNFRNHKVMTESSRLKFIRNFVRDQFLFTKCAAMLLVMNQDLKDPFLKMVGYHKANRTKAQPAPSILGDVFQEDDNIFLYLQDKKSLGFFPRKCLAYPNGKDGQVRLRIFSNSKLN